MKIKKGKIIPFPGFGACNLFGTLYCNERVYNRLTNGYGKTTLNHEEIHTAQMKELLYVPFYILYGLFWLIRVLTPPFSTAYYDISFEQEAYDNQDDLDYLKNRKPYAWLKYCFKAKSK